MTPPHDIHDADTEDLLVNVVAFTVFPSLWVGAPVETIAGSLARALARAVPTEGVAVILRGDTGDVEAVEGKEGALDEDVAAWRATSPARSGTIRIGVGPMGGRGVILLRGETLSKGQALLAQLAATQAATALRESALQQQLGATREQLAKLERLSALGELASGLAHELRTPLTSANNQLHLALTRLARAHQLPQDVRGSLEASIQEAIAAHERIDRTVRTLKAISNPATSRTGFSLSDAVEEAIRLFRLTYAGDVQIVAALDSASHVRGDRGQLQQIVLLLLQNAAEAMPHGGRAQVRTFDASAVAHLVVEDEGGGIPHDARDRIFEPFYTTKAGAMGLGLSIVREIVQDHGATISVGTTPEGGASFTVGLPREPASEPVPPIPRAKTAFRP